METKDIEKKLVDFLEVLNDIGVKLEIDSKNKRVNELESITSDSSFWNDMENAKNVLSELKGLKDVCTKYNNLYSSINTLLEMLEETAETYDQALIITKTKSKKAIIVKCLNLLLKKIFLNNLIKNLHKCKNFLYSKY